MLFRRFLVGVLALAMATLGAVFVLTYTGAYDVAADSPHSAPVAWFLGVVRQRSIEARAAEIAVPGNLGDEKRIAQGAALYAEMCSGCHLGPGLERSEISQGLYPAAPELSRGVPTTPAQSFWVIKHGIKFTAMPAWGRTHSDELIWDMVAFLGKLPTLSPEAYAAAAKNAPEEHEHEMHMHEHDKGGHDHGMGKD